MTDLIKKYNIAVPRYTSYPTVPYWRSTPDQAQWTESVKKTFDATNSKNGISLYIHLPFCESLCTYCACNTRITVNHAVEEPYIETLLREWQLYLSLFKDTPRLKEIHLGGGTPTFFSAPHLKTLIQRILSSSNVCEHAEFSFEAHPDNTSSEHLQTLYDIGFRRVSFGIQDFDPKVQEAIHRRQTVEQVKAVVNEARRIGYTSINFDLIYGLPFQTQDSIIHTIQAVNHIKPDRIAFYSYAHVPWVKPGQRKFTEIDLPVDSIKRKLYETGLQLFYQSGYEAIGMDHFALPNDSLFKSIHTKTLHRNFMGYTSGQTQLLIGLGASSISDTGTCLMQNTKTVEEYTKEIQSGTFAIFKGHLLSEEDLTIRQHILNIMCKQETKWEPDELSYTSFLAGLKRLKPLVKDGLIEVSSNQLRVTSSGKAFLRNICFCLDARYWDSLEKRSIFSSAV